VKEKKCFVVVVMFIHQKGNQCEIQEEEMFQRDLLLIQFPPFLCAMLAFGFSIIGSMFEILPVYISLLFCFIFSFFKCEKSPEIHRQATSSTTEKLKDFIIY
jgi:hypothetical protein